MSFLRVLQLRKLTAITILIIFGFVTIAILSRNAGFLDPDRAEKL